MSFGLPLIYASILLLVLGGCAALPGILGGSAGKDAFVAVEQAIDAIEETDPEKKKADWHNAAEKGAESVVEAGEGALGIPNDVTFDIWDDGKNDINKK